MNGCSPCFGGPVYDDIGVLFIVSCSQSSPCGFSLLFLYPFFVLLLFYSVFCSSFSLISLASLSLLYVELASIWLTHGIGLHLLLRELLVSVGMVW